MAGCLEVDAGEILGGEDPLAITPLQSFFSTFREFIARK